jgi:hypothetical protein
MIRLRGSSLGGVSGGIDMNTANVQRCGTGDHHEEADHPPSARIG